MNNKEIAKAFDRLGKIMELHGENPFKIRSYYSAYNTLRKIDQPLADMSFDELSDIKGVGKAIANKIIELNDTGSLKTYEKYAEITPEGVITMLNVRGFGPKKVKVIWKELEIETIGELLYACNENRLIELKGFGTKTQEQLKKQLQYFIDSQGKYLYGYIIDEAKQLELDIQNLFPNDWSDLSGELARQLPEIENIEIISTVDKDVFMSKLEALGLDQRDEQLYKDEYPVNIIYSNKSDFGKNQFLRNGSEAFLSEFPEIKGNSEEEIFQNAHLPFIAPELRETPSILSMTNPSQLDEIIQHGDIKGLVHCHSTYSDGVHSIEEMAITAKKMGLEYMVISDHSKAAFYADGLTEDRVMAQFEEIDLLNSKIDDFHIYKGIEADILSDGAMDYGDDFLSEFEVVIASVHSNLKMDKDKANHRLIKAIENPYTHILGHPTGRLLLSREGYPIDHMLIIDACAENGMVIELNANPHRLDLDWKWIGYAMEKGVMISINPDSHSKESISYIEYGVNTARKGLLKKNMTINALQRREFDKWVKTLK